MQSQLKVAIGQYSDKGRKPVNQDFHGVCVPVNHQLATKGITAALADGIGSSEVSQIASESAVASFLEDYYCTSEAWSVKKSARRVLTATNSWLYALTRQSQYRYDRDKGYVCTFSALILKSATAHIFHVGDARVYRLSGKALEQLTIDHRLQVSRDTSYLSRALGVNPQLEIDYHAFPIEKGDIFILATDGLYEYCDAETITQALDRLRDPDAAAKALVDAAITNGSPDNLTIQILRVDELPARNLDEFTRQLDLLRPPPPLEAGQELDGYRILRQVHASSRSHLYLALAPGEEDRVILKTPSTEMRQDPAALERFLLEEWIARRVDSPHVVKALPSERAREHLFTVTEYIEGRTLVQWMADNPRPELETVRTVVEQIAKGLRAFHRLEMLHQDLRPANVMIDRTGTVKIIDFGSARVAGLVEMHAPGGDHLYPGTLQYMAPEYFLGDGGSTRSDLFSLGVITYQMLTGKLPYGTEVSGAVKRGMHSRLRYQLLTGLRPDVPAWVDEAIRKAVHPLPHKRFDALSEFLHELRHPGQDFLKKTRPPLIERNPLLFWKGLSLILALALLGVLAMG